MGEINHSLQVGNRVGRRTAGTMARTADIHCVGTVAYGLDSYVGCACGRKKFDLSQF